MKLFTASSNPGLGKFSFVFYLISRRRLFIQDTKQTGSSATTARVAAGRTLHAGGLAGNFVFNWSGVNLGSSANITFEEDFGGDSLSSARAAMNAGVRFDFVEARLVEPAYPAFLNQAIDWNVDADGMGRDSNDYTVTDARRPPIRLIQGVISLIRTLIMLVGGRRIERLLGRYRYSIRANLVQP